MTDVDTTSCNDSLLYEYIDGELSAPETATVERHLKNCPACRRHVRSMMTFRENFRSRVERKTAAVDFSALEKAVVIKALKKHRHQNRSGWVNALKFAIPTLATAGILLFFAYSHLLVDATPMPSAIINSFTASSSSVMIFETPETRQTILWYTETTNAENDNDAV